MKRPPLTFTGTTKKEKKNLVENKLDEENDLFYERYSSLQIALFVDS